MTGFLRTVSCLVALLAGAIVCLLGVLEQGQLIRLGFTPVELLGLGGGLFGVATFHALWLHDRFKSRSHTGHGKHRR